MQSVAVAAQSAVVAVAAATATSVVCTVAEPTVDPKGAPHMASSAAVTAIVDAPDSVASDPVLGALQNLVQEN